MTAKKGKTLYRAYVRNDSGAHADAASGTNLNNLKAYIREHYGKGWMVTIVKIEHDSGIMDFAPVEVAKFTLRK